MMEGDIGPVTIAMIGQPGAAVIRYLHNTGPDRKGCLKHRSFDPGAAQVAMCLNSLHREICVADRVRKTYTPCV
jgi:hypothetical protein